MLLVFLKNILNANLGLFLQELFTENQIVCLIKVHKEQSIVKV